MRFSKMPSDRQLDEMRQLVAEIENMTLTILRDGIEDPIKTEIELWMTRKDEKFDRLKEIFS